MRTFNSTKKYYGKYWYKLEFINSIGHIFRDKNFAYAQSCLETIEQDANKGKELFLKKKFIDIPTNTSDLLDSRFLYNTLINTKVDYLIRIENPIVNIYSSNEQWLKNIGKKLNANSAFYKPNIELASIIDKLVDVCFVKRPTDWKYKVTLKNRVSPEFAKWIDTNRDKIKIGKIAYEYIKQNGYAHGYYFFVKSERVLTMLNLIIGPNIRKVEEVIVDPTIDK